MIKNTFTIKHITRIGILAGISAILLLINFPIGFTSFYKIDFADLPCLLCGFALGPASGGTCVIISVLLNVIIEGGSQTNFVGEFARLLMSLIFVLTSSFIYKKYHTKKGAIVSLILGTLVTSITSLFLNYYVLLPMYETLFRIPLDLIIEEGSKVISIIDSKISFVILCTFPFNLIKGAINSIIIMFVYKRISPLITHI